MRRHIIVLSLLVVCFGLPATASAQEQTQTQQEPLSLGEIARRYQQKKQSTAQTSPPSVVLKATSSFTEDEARYKFQVETLMKERNFDELERLAADARRTKERFAGGAWKLYMFYDAFTRPSVSAPTTDSDWNTHLATLKSWMASHPDSITAPVALARAYIGYASEARGTGFANTVTEEGWKLDAERIAQAKAILLAAAKLKGRCPYWYEAMQQVALSQGWDKSAEKTLFEEAVAFEPLYYHYYREHVNFLLPKWYGEEGEAEDFANEVAGRVEGAQGAFLYFEMASVINCQCGHDEVHMAHLSWPRIKEGYAVLQQLYGGSNLKDNRFAYMAFLARDKSAAQTALQRIGGAWNPQTWRDGQGFEMVRSWASR